MKSLLKKIFHRIRYSNKLGLFIFLTLLKIYRFFMYEIIPNKIYIKTKFYRTQGYKINFENPKTLNEKINWLKLYYRHPKEKFFADKFAVRNEIKHILGDEYLIPLIFHTDNPKNINSQNIPDFPVIVKASHDSGHYKIIKDKVNVDWKKLQYDCYYWLYFDYFWLDREPQYKGIPRRVLVEKLLVCKNGKIPNDYKFHCINGKVEFIYVSYDREGVNKRMIYSLDWQPLPFIWAKRNKNFDDVIGPNISPPKNLTQMIEIAEILAYDFPYVRVDLYDVDGKVYFGEITQHHSGGFDQIRPISWDYYYGNKLNIFRNK